MLGKRNGVGLAAVMLCAATMGQAQDLGTVGLRAAGMAGAFVAVASDSSAVWWNPAALPEGAFVDASMGWMTAAERSEAGDSRARAAGLAFALPMAGLQVARFEVTGRGAAGAPGPRVDVTQVGVTAVHSLVSGLHAGGTVKYLRGAGDGAWDADLGLLAVHRHWRLGLLARQLGAPSLGEGASGARLGRHVRVGGAFDAGAEPGHGVPLTVSADVDLTTTSGPDGLRRDVAVGVEHWIRLHALAIRGGVRASTAGPARPILATGMSLALRPLVFLEVAAGTGTSGGRGTAGAGLRVTF